MKINDELLDRLGTAFVYHQYREKYGWTFEEYVDRWQRGVLDESSSQ